MRFMIPLLLVLGLMAPAVAGAATTHESSYVVAVALQDSQPAPQQSPAQTPQAEPQKAPEPRGQVNVDINTHQSSGAWWMSPLWIGIGAVAVLALIAIIIAASRGSGTTVVKG